MKFTLLGYGKMGSAILTALLANKVCTARAVTVVEPNPIAQKLLKKQGIQTTSDIRTAAATADILLLAVKPQQIAEALAGVRTEALVISILAGTTIRKLRQLTGSNKIVRVMPNTPAQIGAGISGWYATAAITATEKKLINRILATMGQSIELRSEKLLDTVTAISGSGPAYFFAFTEALAAAGKKLGLQDAEAFACATFVGAAKLLEATRLPLATLRENVTSKGGTTYTALTTFQKNKLNAVVAASVHAAKKRSEELSK